MTLQEFMDYLHSQYQGDTSTPSSSDEDWDVRLHLLYDAIAAWESLDGITWAELWAMNSDSADGDVLTVANTAQYDAPSDFRFSGGFVRLIDSTGGSDFYAVKQAHEVELYRNETSKICWFTGNKKAGYKLNFLNAPTAGLEIEYPYYKEPFLPTTVGHVIEMSDPWFAVKYVLSKLHELDGEGDRAGLALSLANGKLQGMKAKNQMPVWFQDNSIPDNDPSESGFGG